MREYKPEGDYRQAENLSPHELEQAYYSGEILQATALAFDQQQRLRIQVAGQIVCIPPEECAYGLDTGQVRQIAVLSRVGRPVCFVVTSLPEHPQGLSVSRRMAQQYCLQEHLNPLLPGDILPCRVSHIEPFGAFCDVGCGISALLPIDCLSISRIQTPADRVCVGQSLYCVLKNRDEQGRLVLSLRELLGTWSENAQRFAVGETVVGIVRSIEEYGVFIEIAPNLAGLAEPAPDLQLGQPVSVYIKNILPQRMKIKLVVVNRNLETTVRFPLCYQRTSGHMEKWVYSTGQSDKQIATVFSQCRSAARTCAQTDFLL